MKYSKLILAAVVSALLFYSCKKDETAIPDSHKVTKIKMITMFTADSNLLDYSTLEYDGLKRLVKVRFLDNSFFSYTYTKNGVSIKSYVTENIPDVSNTDEFTLNSKGLATLETRTWKNKSSGLKNLFSTKLSVSGTSTVTYRYDENQYCVETVNKTSQDSTLTKFTINNGNREAKELIYTLNGGGSLSSKNVYEFNLDHENTLGYYNMGVYFFGKDNVNMIIKDTYKVGSSTNVETFEYEFDNKDRVIKRTTRDVRNRITGFMTYTYY